LPSNSACAHEQLQLGLVATNLRVRPAHQPLRGGHGLIPQFAFRQSEEAAEDAAGQLHRDQLDEVPLTQVGHLAHQVSGMAADPVLQPAHVLGLEGLGRDAAQLGVPWGVHRDERLRDLDRLGGEVLHGDALRRREYLRMAARHPDVVHLGQRPETLGVEFWWQQIGFGRPAPRHRVLPTQRGERFVAFFGRLRPKRPGRQVAVLVGGDGGAHRNPFRRCPRCVVAHHAVVPMVGPTAPEYA